MTRSLPPVDPIIIPLQFLHRSATSTDMCSPRVPPCMWPLSRPPIPFHSGLVTGGFGQKHNAACEHKTLPAHAVRACVSTGSDIIVKHSSVPFDIPKHNACEPASCSQNWKAEEEKLSNHGNPPKCAFNLYRLEKQVPSKQITANAKDVCDKQNICKPDLFQNYETTMGAPLGDTVYSYHLSTLLHASPLIWANTHCDRNSNKYCCKCNSSYHHSRHPTQSSNWCFSLDTGAFH